MAASGRDESLPTPSDGGTSIFRTDTVVGAILGVCAFCAVIFAFTVGTGFNSMPSHQSGHQEAGGNDKDAVQERRRMGAAINYIGSSQKASNAGGGGVRPLSSAREGRVTGDGESFNDLIKMQKVFFHQSFVGVLDNIGSDDSKKVRDQLQNLPTAPMRALFPLHPTFVAKDHRLKNTNLPDEDHLKKALLSSTGCPVRECAESRAEVIKLWIGYLKHIGNAAVLYPLDLRKEYRPRVHDFIRDHKEYAILQSGCTAGTEQEREFCEAFAIWTEAVKGIPRS